MLGPFRISNLRRYPSSRAITEGPPSLSPKKLSDEDAIVCVEGDAYDQTIKAHPEARLKYIDEDDKEEVTVGSQTELSDRLAEPVRAITRSRPRTRSQLAAFPPSPRHMHVFQIDPLEASVKVWEEIEQQTKTLMESQTAAQADLPWVDELNASPRKTKGKELLDASAPSANKGWENRMSQYFKSTNPPQIERTSTSSEPGMQPKPSAMELSTVLNIGGLEAEPAVDYLSRATYGSEVLTSEGKRQAMEAGEKLRSRISQTSQERLPPVSTFTEPSNRWASYSTALETSPTKVKKLVAENPRDTPIAQDTFELGPGLYRTQVAPVTTDNNDNSPGLGQSFYKNFQAQLAKLSDLTQNRDPAPKAPETELPSDDNYGKVEQAPPDYSSERISPLNESAADEPSLSPNLNSQAVSKNEEYPNLSKHGLGNDFKRQSFAPLAPNNNKSVLASYLEQEALSRELEPQHTLEAERSAGNTSIENTQFEAPNDPVEVTVCKMVMQMANSLMSNMSTLNSQIQNQALPRLPEEALKLKGYPDTAHSDDMWRDLDALKRLFNDFDRAVNNSAESFESNYERNTFPRGAGSIRFQGLIAAEASLRAFANAIGDLTYGIRASCVPVSHEGLVAEYHVPKRLTTLGYENTWEISLCPIPHWALPCDLKDFVERALAVYRVDTEVVEANVDATNILTNGTFEVCGKGNAESVLNVLDGMIWKGNHMKAVMKRKLYPSVLRSDAQSSKRAGYSQSANKDSSTYGAAEVPRRSPRDDASTGDKLRAIQDRRAAWRKEYKARTQSVRFEEPSDPAPKEAGQQQPIANTRDGSGSEDPNLRSRGPIVFRHVPSPTAGLGSQNRPIHRPLGGVLPPPPPPKPEIDILHKRRSLPAFKEVLLSRSRSRSPGATQPRAFPPLNRSKSVTFKDNNPSALFKPRLSISTNIYKGGRSVVPNETVVGAPRQPGLENEVLPPRAYVQPNHVAPVPPPKLPQVASFIPYCDQDDGQSMDFRVEQRPSAKPLRQAKSMSSILKLPPYARRDRQRSQEAPASVGGPSGFPTLEEFENKYTPPPRFPPLPTMEPLVPIRAVSFKATSFKGKSHHNPTVLPGSWPEEHERPAESSGAFANRMMGRDFPAQRPMSEVFYTSTSKPRSPPSPLSPVQPVQPNSPQTVLPAANQPAELSAEAVGSWVPQPPRSHVPRRSATVTGASGRYDPSASRRPYSTNFDGNGRVEWDQFLGPRSNRNNSGSTPARPVFHELNRSRSLRAPYPVRPVNPAFTPPNRTAPAPAPAPRRAASFHATPTPAAVSATAAREDGLSIAHENAATVGKVQECVDRLHELGFGAESGGAERLVVYAQSADGNLEGAIDLILEERSAWGFD